MIDLNEPVKKKYSAEEQKEVSQKFLVLLHSFLLFYLALHNLIIPLVINLVKGNHLLLDVHYWFLFQLPVHYWLRKAKNISLSYNVFLIAGSLVRMIFYSFLIHSKSWTLVSVYLSEISTLIFCFVIWHKTFQDRYIYLSFLGFLLPPLMGKIEISQIELRSKYDPAVIHQESYHTLGCQGADVTVNMANTSNLSVSSVIVIKDCGFTANLQKFDRELVLANRSTMDINFRLYEIKKKDGRFSWKFKRILRVEKTESISMNELVKKNTMYLLKSPERRRLGILILVPIKSELSGTFRLNPDSVQWRKDE